MAFKISKFFFSTVSLIVFLETSALAQSVLTKEAWDVTVRPASSGLVNSEGNTISTDAFQKPTGVTFSNDGLKVFVSNQEVTGSHECVSMMTLSKPYDLRTVSSVIDEASPQVTKVGLTDNSANAQCTDIKFSKDGLKIFLGNVTGNIHGFDLATPFDLSNLTYSDNVTDDLGVQANFSFSNDGKKLIYLDAAQENQHIDEYSLSTAYDLTDITLVNTIDLTTTANVSNKDMGLGIEFSQDGMTMFVLIYDNSVPNNVGSDSIFQFSLTKAFSTSTATLLGSHVFNRTFNSSAYGMGFSSTGHKLYLVNRIGSQDQDKWVGGGSVDVVTQISLSCEYGVVACISDPKSSLGTQVQLAKNNVSINTSIIFKRFEWIKRNRNSNNLNNLNASIKLDNPLLNHWVNKFQDKVVLRKASLKQKSTKDEKKNWSYWSHGDLTVGTYHAKSGGQGIILEKPKDIYTSGITFGMDKKNDKNNFSGYAIRYGDGKSKFDQSGHSTTMDSLSLNYYHITPLKKSGYTNTVLGLSSLKYDLITGGVVTGKRNGKQLFTSIDFRNYSKYSKVNLTPTLKINYALTNLSDFTEFMSNVSSAATNVIYEKETFMSGDLATGILFNSDSVKYTDVIVSQNGGLEFVYDYSPDITFAYSYAGSSNTQLYKVENYSQKNIRANYGLESFFNNNFTLSLNYERFQHLDSNKFSHTDSFFIKVGQAKEEDYEFVFNIDAIQDFKINNYYLVNLNGFNLKIGSHYDFVSKIPNYGANIKVSSAF